MKVLIPVKGPVKKINQLAAHFLRPENGAQFKNTTYTFITYYSMAGIEVNQSCVVRAIQVRSLIPCFLRQKRTGTGY